MSGLGDSCGALGHLGVEASGVEPLNVDAKCGRLDIGNVEERLLSVGGF